MGKTGNYSGQEYIDLDDINCEILYSNGNFIVDTGKENRPAIEVTWYGAKSFALFYGLDLPTEVEWEFAARGGQQYNYGTDNGKIDLSRSNYSLTGILHTVDVGNYSANPFGLYDMSGNVWEWCNDWYGEYDSDSATNPTGAQFGSSRVLRGGGWGDSSFYIRTSVRNNFSPTYSDNDFGFRVVRR